jgi:AcrR family transcriptional regulator
MAGRKPIAENKIKKALVQLLDGQMLNEISVAELSAAAGCTRKTFYAHYRDINQAADALAQDAAAAIAARLRQAPAAAELKPAVILNLLEQLPHAPRTLLKRLVRAGGLAQVDHAVQENLQLVLARLAGLDLGRVTQSCRIAISCAASGLLTLYFHYIKEPGTLTAEQFCVLARPMLENLKSGWSGTVKKGQEHDIVRL